MSIEDFDLAKYQEKLDAGLVDGMGVQCSLVCVQAAVCYALGLPHGDDPECVTRSVRMFVIALNDELWSSRSARSAGMRDLGIAQLGSAGVVDGSEFTARCRHKAIKVLYPKFLRDHMGHSERHLAAAELCEKARTEAQMAEALYEASCVTVGLKRPDLGGAAFYAWSVAFNDPESYLVLAAKLAVDVLRELGSPGVALLDQINVVTA